MDFTPVQREHVEKAFADLDSGVSPSGFRDSTTYDVIHQGRPYAPKQTEQGVRLYPVLGYDFKRPKM